jgi:hypothetical protein
MHGLLLALLTALFACRVLGQALAASAGVSWLPPMPQWFSGVIPYPALLIIQLLLLCLMLKITRDIWRGNGTFAVVRTGWPGFLIKFSAVYAALMVLRYIFSMILYPDMRWTAGIIPIIFHFVLAGFIFVFGRYHQAMHDG